MPLSPHVLLLSFPLWDLHATQKTLGKGWDRLQGMRKPARASRLRRKAPDITRGAKATTTAAVRAAREATNSRSLPVPPAEGQLYH